MNYYNDFYRELSEIDEQGNSFSKISDMLPELRGDETFLDVGCGFGGVSHELVKKGFEVHGVEINNEALDTLLKRGFKTYKRDISEPLNIDKCFDVVLLLDVLEHVFSPIDLLQESIKVIKNGNGNAGEGGGVYNNERSSVF